MVKKEIVIAENRDFKGVWTPRKLYLARNLSMSKKNMLIEIYSLTRNDSRKCFASNRHFSDFLGLKENTIQKMMSDLEKDGYINRFYQYVGDTKEIESRTIQLTNKFYKEFINESEEAENKEENESNGKKSTPLIDLIQGEGGGFNSTISNTLDLSDIDTSDTSNSLSNDKDNSKDKSFELHNSQVSEKHGSQISMSLGIKQKQSKEITLKDMPTRAKEIADSMIDDVELSDGVFQCISYFLEKYKQKNHREHLPLKNDTLGRVVEVMLSTLTVEHDEDLENEYQTVFYPLVCYESDWDDRKKVIDKYFETKFNYFDDYGKKINVDCSLVHFTQKEVITHVMQKCYRGSDANWYESEPVN